MNEIELNGKDLNKLPPKSIKHKIVWPWFVLLAIVVAGLAGYIGYKEIYLVKYAKKVSKDSNISTQGESVVSSEEVAEIQKISDLGVNWTTPLKLPDQGLFAINKDYEDMGGCSSIDYYSVGTTSSGSEIIFTYANCLPLSNNVYHFLKKNDQYYLIQKNSSIPPSSSDAAYYNGTVKYLINSDYVLQSILPDETIQKGNSILVHQFNSNIPFDTEYAAGDKILETKWGDLYREVANSALENSSNSAKIARYYIKLNDGSRAYYAIRPVFARDDGTFDLSWKVADNASSSYVKLPTSGCGNGLGSFPMIADDTLISGKTAVAKMGEKDMLFQLQDSSSNLNKYGYNLYTSDTSTGKVSISEYISGLGLVFWIDDFGSSIIYSSSKYMPAVECGKPVIYLYPQVKTEISVSVGANISKSEPEYLGEWNVTANPNGQLYSSGDIFPYLFWEGIGLGKYPLINSGTVIKRQSAPDTIRSQLAFMGLNDKEISDFCEFWIPKLPQKNYIRLTWLTTAELNELAPLKISPKPDSILRVFLDFEGLDNSISIPSQTLKPFYRKGFTVVEWGGLLRK